MNELQVLTPRERLIQRAGLLVPKGNGSNSSASRPNRNSFFATTSSCRSLETTVEESESDLENDSRGGNLENDSRGESLEDDSNDLEEEEGLEDISIIQRTGASTTAPASTTTTPTNTLRGEAPTVRYNATTRRKRKIGSGARYGGSSDFDSRMSELKRQSKQNNSSSIGSLRGNNVSLRGRGNGDITTTDGDDDTGNSRDIYQFSHFLDDDPELRFIKLIAGILVRPFKSLIHIEQVEQQGQDIYRDDDGVVRERVRRLKRYVYHEDVLSGVMTCLNVISQYLIKAYDLQELRVLLIQDLRCATCLARYVAHFIQNVSNALIPRQETSFNILARSQTHNTILISLVAAIMGRWPYIVVPQAVYELRSYLDLIRTGSRVNNKIYK